MEASDKRAKWARLWRKLLRLTRGRVPVLRALRVIVAEETDPDDGRVIAAVLEAMEAGATMSDALVEHPFVFSPSVLELVRAAEESGAWDEILQEIADGLDDGTFD